MCILNVYSAYSIRVLYTLHITTTIIYMYSGTQVVGYLFNIPLYNLPVYIVNSTIIIIIHKNMNWNRNDPSNGCRQLYLQYRQQRI